MTTELMLRIIPGRMRELGFGEDYRMAVRSVAVPAGGSATLRMWNTWCWFPLEYLDRSPGLVVESDVGYLDLNSGKYSSKEFEHTGKLILRNSGQLDIHATFVAVSPLRKHQNLSQWQDTRTK